MSDFSPVLRAARPGDARELAELVNMAGEGLPHHYWTSLAGPGETPWDVGIRRARRDTGGFSYRNARGIEHDGRLAACLIGWPLPESSGHAGDPDTPAAFVPLIELEWLAAGTWYVNVLAVCPACRGRGWGRRLLDEAERLAGDAGCAALSLIVADTNAPARGLYGRSGFREAAARPMVKDGWDHVGADWLLLKKPL